MPKLLENATFDIIGKGWKPVAVSKVGFVPVKTGKHKGTYRIPLTLTITEGKYEGRKLFEGCMLSMLADEGKNPPAVFARRKLEALDPSTDWGDYDFPTNERDKAGIDELSDTLIGCTGYALVDHEPARDDPRRLVEVVKNLAPGDAEIEWSDDVDDEDDEAA